MMRRTTGVLSDRLQGGADAFQGEAHADPEVLRSARRQVGAVRVDRLGVGVEEVLDHVVGVDLAHPAGHAGITGSQRFRNRLRLMSGELELEDVVLDPSPPVVVDGHGAPRPGGTAAIELQLLVAREIEVAGGELGGEARACSHAQPVAVEDLEREVQPAAPQGVVDPGPVEVEVGDVAGEEHAVARIQDVDIAVEDAGAELVIERDLAVVVAAHELDDGPGRTGMRGSGTDLLRRGGSLLRGARGRAAQDGDQEGRRGKERAGPRRRPARCRGRIGVRSTDLPDRCEARAGAAPPAVPSARRYRDVVAHQKAFRTSSTICLASPNNIIVLSRKNSSFSTPAYPAPMPRLTNNTVRERSTSRIGMP